ncbi:MAG: TOBE domain-containing protein, partial [Kiloniellales bacterium]|nr:TOBE domain-containing protein [Kiloniellales bacterium]
GEVNTLEVEAVDGNSVRDRNGAGDFKVARMPEGFREGFLIVRPEMMKMGEAASSLSNSLEGKIFNDYALGSRIQYQIRSPNGSHWLVERLQDEAFDGAIGDEVMLGWRPEDSILVSD